MLVVISEPSCQHCRIFISSVLSKLEKYVNIIIPHNKLIEIFGLERLSSLLTTPITLPMVFFIKNEQVYKIKATGLSEVQQQIEDILNKTCPLTDAKAVEIPPIK